MAPRDMTDAVKSMVYGSDYPEKGVRVTQQNGRLVIELHIAVSYGLNISTAARSISHRVKDEVEQATGLKVARVVVSVDDVIAGFVCKPEPDFSGQLLRSKNNDFW